MVTVLNGLNLKIKEEVTAMDLTYLVSINGYTIYKDGVAWVVQDENRFPYPGKTPEESAQNHINVILADNTVRPEEIDVITQLRIALAEMAEVQESEKLNNQLALAELAEAMIGGVV